MVVYRNELEGNIQFYLHVAYDIFNGNEEEFISIDNDDFEVQLFRKTQVNKTLLLSLCEQSMLRILLSLYRGKLFLHLCFYGVL